MTSEPSRIIRENFLVVSNHNNDVSWVKDYTDNYLVYDKSDDTSYTQSLDTKKVIRTENIGYNLTDYFRFIIDNYDNLPQCTVFVKGNIVPRHVSKEFFDAIVNNDYFTPIEDYTRHATKWPVSFIGSDGGFCEINNSWYLAEHPTKYFHNYNDFLRFCFVNPVIPRYNQFAPGACYIVPRENILKLPKVFYENLSIFVSHCPLPGEAHILERALRMLWTSNFQISSAMLQPFDAAKHIPLPAKPLGNKLIAPVKKLIPKPVSTLAWEITHPKIAKAKRGQKPSKL